MRSQGERAGDFGREERRIGADYDIYNRLNEEGSTPGRVDI